MTPARAAELWHRVELLLVSRGIKVSDDDRAALIRTIGEVLLVEPSLPPIEPDTSYPVTTDEAIELRMEEARRPAREARRRAPRPAALEQVIDLKLKEYLDRAHSRRGTGYDFDDGVEY